MTFQPILSHENALGLRSGDRGARCLRRRQLFYCVFWGALLDVSHMTNGTHTAAMQLNFGRVHSFCARRFRLFYLSHTQAEEALSRVGVWLAPRLHIPQDEYRGFES